jgi:hypothetical protein
MQSFSQICRELGDRGRPLQLSESMVEAANAAAVSAREGATMRAQALAAPAPASVPAPRSTALSATARTTPAAAAVAAAAVPPAPPASPTSAAPPVVPATTAAAATSNGVSGSELLQFVKHQQEREDVIRQAAENKLEKLRQELRGAAAEVITAARLETFQARIEQLQASNLLSRDVAEVIEDSVADVAELLGLQPSATVSHPVAEKVLRMVSLSELITVDATLVRQLMRKLK